RPVAPDARDRLHRDRGEVDQWPSADGGGPMARSTFVVALACATLLLAACGATAGAPSGSETTVASLDPTPAAVSPSAAQATPGESGATLPGLAVQATVEG